MVPSASDLWQPHHSGTERVGPLLNSILIVQEARVVVEVGSGFTSAFLLDALATVQLQRTKLIEKVGAFLRGTTLEKVQLCDFFHAVGPVDVEKLYHHRQNHSTPLLVLFDQDKDYLERVVDVLRKSPAFTIVDVIPLHYEGHWPIALPSRVGAVDFAFNDDENYLEFARQFVPLLADRFGMLGVHNTHGMWRDNADLCSSDLMRPFQQLTI